MKKGWNQKARCEQSNQTFCSVIAEFGRYVPLDEPGSCVSLLENQPLSFFVVKTVGGMKGRDFGQKTMEQNRHGYCQSQNLCVPLPTFPPSRCLSTRLSDSFSPCSVGVMSGAHRALPMIYTVTRWRWRIAALLPDVSRKTNGDGGSYRIGFGRGGVWRGREMAYREDGCDWRLYVRSECCSWCKKV